MIKPTVRITGIAIFVSAALLVALTAHAAPSRADTGIHVLSMDTIKGSTSATVTATPAVATFTNTPTLSATPTAPTCLAPWVPVSSPNEGFGDNYLHGVATLATDDAWAVGYFVNSLGIEQTLIQHWDGVRWSIVASPNVGSPSTTRNFLLAVSAISPDDIWAVGYDRGRSTTAYTLILHWDGQQWSLTNTAIVGVLNAVSKVGSDDVWAVGTTADVNLNGVTPLTLTVHWDGQSWQTVPSPNFDPDADVLYGVTAISTDDVWAAGHYGWYQRLILEHWDGQQWSMVFVEEPFEFNDVFYAIDAITSGDIWAVGKCCHDPQETISFHWDGSNWVRAYTPHTFIESTLYGVATISHDNVWAVGIEFPTGMRIIHWNGTQWSRVGSPPNTDEVILRAIADAGANNIWAVGNDGFSQGLLKRTFTVHYDGICSNPSATPTPTPTACPIEFTDVPSGSTFYPYVRCLACRGVLGGYPDDTFRPNDNLTRGQAAKIVSNAAGFSDDIPPTQQTFSDVPPGSTFWVYVERGYAHGVFSGYPCGGTGEPCDPQQRPYYRPGNNLSRGQLAKVATNGAGYIDQISPDQASFIDVPSDDPFWIYVERAVAHSIISGYPCGGVGEPCDEYNRPYYRPAANVSRGQTAKIVSNTFFPDCQTP